MYVAVELPTGKIAQNFAGSLGVYMRRCHINIVEMAQWLVNEATFKRI